MYVDDVICIQSKISLHFFLILYAYLHKRNSKSNWLLWNTRDLLSAKELKAVNGIITASMSVNVASDLISVTTQLFLHQNSCGCAHCPISQPLSLVSHSDPYSTKPGMHVRLNPFLSRVWAALYLLRDWVIKIVRGKGAFMFADKKIKSNQFTYFNRWARTSFVGH